MITLRRAEERHHDRSREQEVWLTFFLNGGASPFGDGFGTLEILDEGRLPPGGGITRRPRRDAEIVTFVREGTLAWEDSMDCSGLVQAGEFRRMTSGRGVRHRETNASQTDWAHVFQVWLHPAQADLEPSHEQKRFSVAERRGRLCVVGSPDGRRGSLRIHQDALMYSALLEPGTHLVHELSPGRGAWLHLVEGEATLGDLVLTTGDGAGIWAERAVSLTAEEPTEILLLDLCEPLPGPTSEELP
jgi:quercetin 2,3-dioxygenase